MLSPSAKGTLDLALNYANEEGHAVWGFIVNAEQTDFQPFGNATENIDDFIKNVEEGVRLLKQAYLAKCEA